MKGGTHFFAKKINMKKRLKQCVGIDVSQKTLDVCLGYVDDNLKIHFVSQRKFNNQPSSMSTFSKWITKHTESDVKTVVVMEATGVYHQDCAHHLHANNFSVCIELPNKISNYVRSLNQKTKTDKKDAQAICQYGLERDVKLWAPPLKIYQELCAITRERAQLRRESSMIKNKLHAERASYNASEKMIDRIKIRLVLIQSQIKQIEKELREKIKSDNKIQEDIMRTQSIVGIGFLTAAIIHAETRGFALIENKKQLSSYAGYDIRQKQSGTSVNGKTSISKKGNRHLRAAMHHPAMASVRHHEPTKIFCARIIKRSGIPMKGYVAVQRHLLELAFILHKNKTTFDKEYHHKKAAEENLHRSLADNKIAAF